jgi:hypothetical protein
MSDLLRDSESVQRAVMGLLLERHPALVDVPSIETALPDLQEVERAVDQLIGDGLATRLGGRIGAAWAIVRFEALGL